MASIALLCTPMSNTCMYQVLNVYLTYYTVETLCELRLELGPGGAQIGVYRLDELENGGN